MSKSIISYRFIACAFMGLLGDGLLPFKQPNLVPNDGQREIIDGLANLAWDLR